jgi:hypothetical protein
MADNKNGSKPKQGPVTELVTKINTKACGVNKERMNKKLLKDKDTAHPIAHVYGHASRYTIEDYEGRPYMLFHGNFRAKSLLIDRKLRSGRLILPAVAEGVLAGELDMHREDGATVQFGITLTARWDETSGPGYTWGAIPFMEGTEDPLAEIEAVLPS